MFVSHLIQKLQKESVQKRIIFPEGVNPLVQRVAQKLTKDRLAICFLVFKTRKEVPQDLDLKIKPLIIEEYDLDDLANHLYQLRKGKVDWKESRFLVQQTNYFAIMLLKLKKVDCFLGGIEYSTADILRPAFQIIKTKTKETPATSAFLMVKDDHHLLFADCALNIDPDVNGLINIAKNTTFLADVLGFKEKKIAMLSFSSAGSGGKAPTIQKVQAASQQLQNHFEGQTKVLGDIQFDAAFSEAVRAKKWPKDRPNFNGGANIFIFPDLNAGNIGYKIAQRLGHYEAIGPIIIGLNAPVNDLSRGASEKDIYQTAILTLSQVVNHKKNE